MRFVRKLDNYFKSLIISGDSVFVIIAPVVSISIFPMAEKTKYTRARETYFFHNVFTRI